MFKQDITIADVITAILTTAMSAGGFYLLAFMATFFIVSPLGLLLAYILLNALNIWYHLSKYYNRVFDWTHGYVVKAIDYLKTKPWFVKLSITTILATTYVISKANVIKDKLAPITSKITGLFTSLKSKFKSNKPVTTIEVAAN